MAAVTAACACSEAGVASLGVCLPRSLFLFRCLGAVGWKQERSPEQLVLSLCRTRKMRSQRPSSLEKGRRRARSTGNARSQLPALLSSSPCWFSRPHTLHSASAVPSSPPPLPSQICTCPHWPCASQPEPCLLSPRSASSLSSPRMARLCSTCRTSSKPP